jgi:hypothetical protein
LIETPYRQTSVKHPANDPPGLLFQGREKTGPKPLFINPAIAIARSFSIAFSGIGPLHCICSIVLPLSIQKIC